MFAAVAGPTGRFQNSVYWSNNTYAGNAVDAWIASYYANGGTLISNQVAVFYKIDPVYVRAVRTGTCN